MPDLNTAVLAAAAAIRTEAAKLASMSSMSPGDVEKAAATLNQIAAGLEVAVAEPAEPIPEPPPLDAVEPGAEPNPPPVE